MKFMSEIMEEKTYFSYTTQKCEIEIKNFCSKCINTLFHTRNAFQPRTYFMPIPNERADCTLFSIFYFDLKKKKYFPALCNLTLNSETRDFSVNGYTELSSIPYIKGKIDSFFSSRQHQNWLHRGKFFFILHPNWQPIPSRLRSMALLRIFFYK